VIGLNNSSGLQNKDSGYLVLRKCGLLTFLILICKIKLSLGEVERPETLSQRGNPLNLIRVMPA